MNRKSDLEAGNHPLVVIFFWLKIFPGLSNWVWRWRQSGGSEGNQCLVWRVFRIYMRRKGTNYEDTWALFIFPNHSSCQSFTKQGPHLTSGLGNQTSSSPTDVETFEWCDWWRYQLRRSVDIGFALFILFLMCFKESCQAVLEKYPKPPIFLKLLSDNEMHF